jgi:hypothetical protein
MLMIVLRSPIVADLCAAVHREELRLVRREASKASKAPEGYSRFDVAVAEAVRATGWPEHKTRQAMRQAVAAGQLTAHDHECLALTKPVQELEDHHVIRDEALDVWLKQFIQPPQGRDLTPTPGSESESAGRAGDVAEPVAGQTQGADSLGAGGITDAVEGATTPTSRRADRNHLVETAVEEGLRAIRTVFANKELTTLPTYLHGTHDRVRTIFIRAASNAGIGERAAHEQWRQLVANGVFGPKGRCIDKDGRYVDHLGDAI